MKLEESYFKENTKVGKLEMLESFKKLLKEKSHTYFKLKSLTSNFLDKIILIY